MKRLTYKTEQNERAYCPPNVKCNGNCNHCVHIDKMMNKLSEYEDAEEKGLLLKLPCPFGTKIYCIHSGIVEEGLFFEMSCFKFKDYYKKSWFLTKEEAEQALAKDGD